MIDFNFIPVDLHERLNKPGLKAGDMSPDEKYDHTYRKADAENWHINHPPSHKNIVSHFNQATQGEKHAGMSWYKNAHDVAHVISKDTGVPHHTVTGLIANYSPQTEWHTNMHTASRIAKTKTPLGGPNQPKEPGMPGVMASNRQKENAHRMLSGEHYDKILKGDKIRHFAHLIEHGGNKDEKNPHVAIDRHAWSVASGARMPSHAYEAPPKSKYKSLVGMYQKASSHINKQSGAKPGDDHHVKPHQVQAVTWLVRQRLNNQEDAAHAAGNPEMKRQMTDKAHSVEKSRHKATDMWHKHAEKHHPDAVKIFPKGSGTSSSA